MNIFIVLTSRVFGYISSTCNCDNNAMTQKFGLMVSFGHHMTVIWASHECQSLHDTYHVWDGCSIKISYCAKSMCPSSVHCVGLNATILLAKRKFRTGQLRPLELEGAQIIVIRMHHGVYEFYKSEGPRL